MLKASSPERPTDAEVAEDRQKLTDWHQSLREARDVLNDRSIPNEICGGTSPGMPRSLRLPIAMVGGKPGEIRVYLDYEVSDGNAWQLVVEAEDGEPVESHPTMARDQLLDGDRIADVVAELYMAKEGRELDMDVIVDHVRRMGVWAYVEQTGGGCATIFAGAQRVNAAGDPVYAVCAGPGRYGWGKLPSTGHADEFFVGADDQGETEPIDCAKVGALTEDAIAKVIVQWAAVPPAAPEVLISPVPNGERVLLVCPYDECLTEGWIQAVEEAKNYHPAEWDTDLGGVQMSEGPGGAFNHVGYSCGRCTRPVSFPTDIGADVEWW